MILNFKKKTQKFLFLFALISFFIIPFQKITVYAGSLKTVSQVSDMDTDGVTFVAEDGTIKTGSEEDVFNYLKDKHGDETYSQDSSLKWKDVSTSMDGLDAKIFGSLVNSSGSTLVASMISSIQTILTVTQSEFNTISSWMTTAITPIAYALCLLYLVMDLAGKSYRELTSFQSLTESFLKFAIGFLFVQYTPALLSWLWSLSNTAMNDLIAAATGGSSMDTSSLSALQNSLYSESEVVALAMQADANSWLSSLGAFPAQFLNFVIGNAASALVLLGVAVMCYARKLEIGIRSLFMPIALADISGKGLNSNGTRYLRKFIGVMLQAAAIVALVLYGASISTTSTVFGAGLMIPIAILGAVGTAKRIAEEAFGG